MLGRARSQVHTEPSQQRVTIHHATYQGNRCQPDSRDRETERDSKGKRDTADRNRDTRDRGDSDEEIEKWFHQELGSDVDGWEKLD